MNSGPLVSILIPNYNYGRFLAEAIDSALAQTYRNTEVIVVDDGSTDDSREVIAGYGDRIIPILKENEGQASAFNAGFAASRGEWIALLDSDDTFEPAKMERVLDLASRHPDALFLAHNLEHFDERGPVELGLPRLQELQVCDLRRSVAKGRIAIVFPATSGLVFKKELASRILPMPLDVYDNYLKVVAVVFSPVLLVPEKLARQRIHEANFYTGQRDSEAGRIQHALIAIRTAYRARNGFPQLSLWAWKVYGRSMQELLAIRSPEATKASAMAWHDYNVLDKTAKSVVYAGGAFLKSRVRAAIGKGPA
jgi:glycosyltransferase involved in cell wall biosynthesis